MVWRLSKMYSSSTGSDRRRLTEGGVTLGTAPNTSGGVVGVQRYKLYGHNSTGKVEHSPNIEAPITTATGSGIGESASKGNKAKQQEVFNQIHKYLTGRKK